MRKSLFLFLAAVGFVFVSCEKTPEKEEQVILPSQEGGIFFINEGGFGHGDATLGFYDFKNKTLNTDVFQPANGRPLGDVLQSVTQHQGILYLVVNNSRKIEVMNGTDFKSIGTISGFVSPRYMLFVDDQTAYVSDLKDQHIAIVNTASGAITGKISCPGSTEQMVYYNQKVYVTNTSQRSLYIIDPAVNQVTDSIVLSAFPQSLAIDAYGKLWVLCKGDGLVQAALYRINPVTKAVEKAFTGLATDGIFGACNLTLDGPKKRLFWLSKDVWMMNITDTVAPAQPLLESNGGHLYGVGIDPVAGDLYVADALNFSQRSVIYHYKPYANDFYYLGDFQSGINTNGFYFWYK